MIINIKSYCSVLSVCLLVEGLLIILKVNSNHVDAMNTRRQHNHYYSEFEAFQDPVEVESETPYIL